MVRVVFLHPDLGIGGAERAVIDAALALKSSGHSVHFVTAHHDPDHCFPETRDGTVAVTAVGDWLPRSVLNRFYALCAYIRMIYAAVYLVFFSRIQYDVVFCDQISACIPVLRVGRAKVLFYCHFPDMLLTQRRSFLKRLYRAPIDRLEELTTGLAHVVLVNSKFTADIFHETFRSLQDIKPQVVYPIPNFTALDQPADNQLPDNVLAITANINTIFLSINRYERKKNLPLALHALAKLKARRGDLDGVQLIIAGGYDDRVMENKEHYLELRMLADSLKVQGHISFMRSFSDGEKRTLLHHSTCLLYTPDKEHFGIVPVEAMYLQCPVIAVRSGGPLETVLDGQTGYLCAPKAGSFADAMEKFVTDRKLGAKLGKAGRQRVIEKFSFETFTKQLNSTVLGLCQP